MTHKKIDERIVGERFANLKILFSSLILDPAIELVYLFGSRTSNTAGPLSDYDIAVYFSDMPDHNLKYYLGHQVTTVLDTDMIDIVVLNQSPIELRYAVIATGTVIYEITKAARLL